MHPCGYIVDHLLHVLTIQNPSVERECDDLPGDELAAHLQRLLCGHFESTAAWHLHAHDCDGLDVVLADDPFFGHAGRVTLPKCIFRPCVPLPK